MLGNIFLKIFSVSIKTQFSIYMYIIMFILSFNTFLSIRIEIIIK